MSKRDYELIAASIARTRQACDIGGTAAAKSAKAAAVRLAALDLAASLARTNNRFDRARFLKACGVA